MAQVRRSSLKTSISESTTIHKVKFRETAEAKNNVVDSAPVQNGTSQNGNTQLLSRRNSAMSCPPAQPLTSRSGNSFPAKRRLSLPTLGTEQSSFNHRCQPIVNKNSKPQQKYSGINSSAQIKPVLPLLINTGAPSTSSATNKRKFSAGITSERNSTKSPGVYLQAESDSRSFCDSVSTIACSNISSTSSGEPNESSTIIPLSLNSYTGKNGRDQIEDWLTMLNIQK